MRTRSEFLTRMSEYGWLKYEQPVCRVTDEDGESINPSSVYVFKFLKGHSDITVLWDSSSDDVVTLIGGCHDYRKEVIQIVSGTDDDE
jgi:hypothetical protein